MKMTLIALTLATLSWAAVASDSAPLSPVSINISKRKPIDVKDVFALRTYATENSYYFSVHLREGMRVLYSASYGIGGEAAQARGTLVERDGKFYFKQSANPSSNLLLPPGSPLNSHESSSLWDIGEYMELVNRVAFSDPNKASHTANDIYGAPEAAIVDFEGGTAGQMVQYKDALETGYSKTVGNRSDSRLKIYYAKGIGPVALEFRENMMPAGTFKFYVGE